MRNGRRSRIVGGRKAVLFVIFAAIALTVFGFAVMNLWNWLIPELFHGRMITFWQALGVLVLSRILVGGFFGRGCRRARIVDRFEQLTPEERDKFRAAMRGGWRGAQQPDVL